MSSSQYCASDLRSDSAVPPRVGAARHASSHEPATRADLRTICGLTSERLPLVTVDAEAKMLTSKPVCHSIDPHRHSSWRKSRSANHGDRVGSPTVQSEKELTLLIVAMLVVVSTHGGLGHWLGNDVAVFPRTFMIL